MGGLDRHRKAAECWVAHAAALVSSRDVRAGVILSREDGEGPSPNSPGRSFAVSAAQDDTLGTTQHGSTQHWFYFIRVSTSSQFTFERKASMYFGRSAGL
jgi:hypothetical protein